MMKTITEQLDELDEQYSNICKMPKPIREKYNRLSLELIGNVWEKRIKHHGSIHSHLKANEKDGV